MRAISACENRSRIEAGAIHERFSPRFSFVYQRWCVTRTIPVGRSVRSSGAFQAKLPRACVAQAVFRPRFVRVPSVVQYANDFRARFRSCIEGGALRERFPDPGEGAGRAMALFSGMKRAKKPPCPILLVRSLTISEVEAGHRPAPETRRQTNPIMQNSPPVEEADELLQLATAIACLKAP